MINHYESRGGRSERPAPTYREKASHLRMATDMARPKLNDFEKAGYSPNVCSAARRYLENHESDAKVFDQDEAACADVIHVAVMNRELFDRRSTTDVYGNRIPRVFISEPILTTKYDKIRNKADGAVTIKTAEYDEGIGKYNKDLTSATFAYETTVSTDLEVLQGLLAESNREKALGLPSGVTSLDFYANSDMSRVGRQPHVPRFVIGINRASINQCLARTSIDDENSTITAMDPSQGVMGPDMKYKILREISTQSDIYRDEILRKGYADFIKKNGHSRDEELEEDQEACIKECLTEEQLESLKAFDAIATVAEEELAAIRKSEYRNKPYDEIDTQLSASDRTFGAMLRATELYRLEGPKTLGSAAVKAANLAG